MSYNLTTMQSIYHNQDEIVEITYNGSSVYQKSSGPDYTEPFYVENISNGNETLNIKKSSAGAPDLTIEYSTDKTTWQTLGTTSTTALTYTLHSGDKLYLRCNADTWSSSTNYNIITGISKVSGNIMSLLYGSNFTGQETSFPNTASSYIFKGLFNSNNKLIDASNLLLPAVTLTSSCYQIMFQNCTLLTAAPALPAITLASNCYASMFVGCTSLTTAPELPATTLFDGCYQSMFVSCTSLTTAPALPATTLTSSCYYHMFESCTSLTTAPALPATTLTYTCYERMFAGCTSLTTAPAISATTLAYGCCYEMFRNCTSLATAPALLATALGTRCYMYMFSGCTSLNTIECLATNISADLALYKWVENVSSTGTFTKAVGVTWPTGISGIPDNWTVVEV